MKKFFILGVILLVNSALFSQVAINADGRAADSSAALDINFIDRGFLLPRLTFEQRNAIPNPAEGLMVFCIDCSADASGALSIYQNGLWRIFNLDCVAPYQPAKGTAVSSLHQIVWNWESVPIANGYRISDTNFFDCVDAIDVGIETSYADTGLACWSDFTRYVWAYNECGHSPVQILEASTSTAPFGSAPVPFSQIPSASSITWSWSPVSGAHGYYWSKSNNLDSAIALPANQVTYLETGLTCLHSYTRYVWARGECGVSTATALTATTTSNPPGSPVAAAHIATPFQITWDWDPVDGATGYKWSNSNSYGTAIDLGTKTDTTETGLSCNTAYTRYVWAYSNCGVSAFTILNKTTALNPPAAPVAGTHVSAITQIDWTWNVVSGATGYKWNTVNDTTGSVKVGNVTHHLETGLSCNTPYTRYVWAFSNCGTSISTTLIDTTLLNPPAAPTAGTHVTQPFQITWDWNPVTGAAGYKWNTTNNYNTAFNLGTKTDTTETGLNCNTIFNRYVWAYNNCGVSTPLMIFDTTSLYPPAAPVAGTHVPSQNQIVWNWSTVPGASSYMWNTTNTLVGATDIGNVTSYTESLPCNSPYTRYVWAKSNCGISGSKALTASTLTVPPAQPVAATHIPGPSQIEWKWRSVPGATSYKWGSTNVFESAINVNADTSFIQGSLNCNTAYTSYVWAIGPCGISNNTALNQTTSLNPPPPPSPAAHVPTYNQITWKWHPIPGATSYKWNTVKVYSGAITLIDTTHIETGLPCNHQDTSYIWAVTNCGTSSSGTLVQATLPNPPGSPIEGTHVSAPSQIEWHWNSVSGATGYKWGTSSDYAQAQDMGTALVKTETNLACNIPYVRYVWAYSACGVSNPTTLNANTTNAGPAAPTPGTHDPSVTQIIWNWNAVTGATGYKWNDVNDFASADDMASNTTLVENGLVCNTLYTRYIWSYNACNHSASTSLTATTDQNSPVAPVAAIHIPDAQQIIWKWTTVSGVTGYILNTTNDTANAIYKGADTSYTETGLTCNTQYTHYVWSYNNCGLSSATMLAEETNSVPIAAPDEGTHIAGVSQIEWYWSSVAGATGYKWNSANNYGTATDMGTNTSHLQTGMNCNTLYTSYVWAYAGCGNSTVTMLSNSTLNEPPATPVAGTHVPAATQIIWNWNAVPGATGYRWNTSNTLSGSTDLGNVVTITETGLVCGTPYTHYLWAYNGCGNSVASVELTATTTTVPPSTPIAGTHVPTYTQITWNWDAVPDAAGYKWSTTFSYSGAADIGNVTSKVQTGLTCGTNYTCYVWAYNSCGHSTAVTMIQATLNCWTCGSPLLIDHVAGNVAPVNKSTTYGTVTNVPGETAKCWITSNLGSDHQASNYNDITEASAGWYWQFDHLQGFKHDGATRTPNTTWITNIYEYLNWSASNDPCTSELGAGWRIPTRAEWTNVDASGGWSTWSGPWNSVLKMHAAGRLSDYDGSLSARGLNGMYWSSTQSNESLGWRLNFTSSVCSMGTIIKDYGFSIRCVKD